MSITLGTNVSSLRGQRQLFRSTEALETAFERLSTGQRINRASDDAAGLAVVEQLSNKRSTQSVALRNVNDGISMLSIAEGALAEQTKILFRMTELAEQSANGVYAATQRRALQNEYEELLKEFGRIGDSTEFNGKKLLAGGARIDLQVGTSGSVASRLEIEGYDSSFISGTINVDALKFADHAAAAAAISSNVSDSSHYTWSLEELQEIYGTTAIEIEAGNSLNAEKENALLFFLSEEGGGIGVIGFTQAKDPADTPVDSTNRVGEEIYYGAVNTADILYSQLNTFLRFDPGGKVNHFATGSIVSLNSSVDPPNSAVLTSDFSGLRFSGNSDGHGYIQGGGTSAIAFSRVDTVPGARNALDVAQNRIAELTRERSKLGVMHSRLEITHGQLRAQQDVLADSVSRIQDADIALESSTLVKQQILQQTATSVLAQANQQPAIALQILS